MSWTFENRQMEPQSRELLDQINSFGFPPIASLAVDDARRLMDSFAWQSTIQLQEIQDLAIPGPNGDIPIRLYTPKGTGPFKLLVYHHGGGWVLGSIHHKDAVCRYLAEQAGCVVISVEYRRPPEDTFPKPLEDCYAAFLWAHENAESFGAKPDSITIAGDSCGGNLAACVTLLARDRKGPKIAQQVLIFPATDHNFETPSYKAFAKGYLVPREDMIWYWSQYLNTPQDAKNPYAAPLQADTANLPPAIVVLAEFDPLFDDGLAYAKKMQDAGCKVTVQSYPSFHGFTDFFNQLPVGKEALDKVILWLSSKPS